MLAGTDGVVQTLEILQSCYRGLDPGVLSHAILLTKSGVWRDAASSAFSREQPRGLTTLLHQLECGEDFARPFDELL